MITHLVKFGVIGLIFCFSAESLFGQEKEVYKINTIAFYNVENLFDTVDDPLTFDDDRTPNGEDRWTQDKYEDKLSKIARVLSEVGVETAKTPPAIIGLCEVENRSVVEDLLNQPALKPQDYGIIHYDSPDRRGIDVALIYKKAIFKPLHSVSHRLMLYDPKNGITPAINWS